MTKQQIKEKIRILSDEIDVDIHKCIDKVLKSEGINIDEWEDNFRLPKIILSAALKHLAWQYEPFDSSDKNTVSNIILLL